MEKSKGTSLETVLKAVVSLGEKVATLPTKNDMEKAIEDAKEEILKEVRPVARAVDKDAVTIVKHEKRITRIETHLSLK